mgnify:CR=1 FL=1
MYDRRRKLTDEQKAAILARYKAGDTIRGMAREYGVTVRTIHVIVRPDVKEKVKVWAHEYYVTHPRDKEYTREQMRKTREYQKKYKEKMR